MKKNNKKKIRFTVGERLLIFVSSVLLFGIALITVFCGSMIGNLTMTVEKLKYQISEQEKKNESLTMQVNELTSYDKIKDVVKEMGLAYNNENIIVIGE